MRCEHCGTPLDLDVRSDARYCSPAHRVAAYRARRKVEAEAERRAIVDRARELLKAQTAAINSGDLQRLDAASAEAEAWLASLV